VQQTAKIPQDDTGNPLKTSQSDIEVKDSAAKTIPETKSDGGAAKKSDDLVTKPEKKQGSQSNS
jgi:hypothetical protein